MAQVDLDRETYDKLVECVSLLANANYHLSDDGWSGNYVVDSEHVKAARMFLYDIKEGGLVEDEVTI